MAITSWMDVHLAVRLISDELMMPTTEIYAYLVDVSGHNAPAEQMIGVLTIMVMFAILRMGSSLRYI
ncbi:hypothetical protein ARMGADRAFT_1011673 [Armillaria gallica]|uniref:Uncharacterized protein n=1 Tax=Armillaria gallica TaxID=47427 RepID=A0A2H3DHU9_ARMGA|nr:hypothetical protein ARMGADRAFT_1011673 [Armillaria gallica]